MNYIPHYSFFTTVFNPSKICMSGCCVHPFISNNFTQVDKKDNLSNHWYWDCNFCDANHAPGCHIKGWDNNLLLHVINAKLCPNASADACREAQAILMEKGKITVSEVVLPIRDDSIATTGDSAESTSRYSPELHLDPFSSIQRQSGRPRGNHR